MKKEVVARTSRVPAEPDGTDEYAGMPVVLRDEPEYAELMAPETARIGTTIQHWYRLIIAPVRLIAWVLMRTGELILKLTMYWYTLALAIFAVASIAIIFATR